MTRSDKGKKYPRCFCGHTQRMHLPSGHCVGLGCYCDSFKEVKPQASELPSEASLRCYAQGCGKERRKGSAYCQEHKKSF